MATPELPSTAGAASLPGFPADKPVPTEPVEGVDLARYARISARLNEKREPRAQVLAAESLDEKRWLNVELAWPLRIAAAALRGDRSLAESYDREYVAAQDALGPTEPTLPLDRYAQLTARITAGEDAAKVASAAGLSLADWTRLMRAWTARLAKDVELTKAFRAMVAAALPRP